MATRGKEMQFTGGEANLVGEGKMRLAWDTGRVKPEVLVYHSKWRHAEIIRREDLVHKRETCAGM